MSLIISVLFVDADDDADDGDGDDGDDDGDGDGDGDDLQRNVRANVWRPVMCRASLNILGCHLS